MTTSTPSPLLRLAQVVFAVVTSLLTAGLIFGFAALKPVLIHEGVYEYLCESDAAREAARETGRPCLEQDLKLNLSFTISVVLTNLAALPIGLLLDNVGPKKTSLIGAVVFAAGSVAMGLDRTSGIGAIIDPFLTSYMLLAVGGPMLFLSSFHLCNAFPQKSGLVLSAIIGAFDASSLPFVVYAAIYRNSNHTVHLKQWFWAYLIIPAVVFVWQAFLGSAKPYDRNSASEEDDDEADDDDERTNLVGSAQADRSHNYGTNDSLLRVGSNFARPGSKRHPSVYDSQFSRILDAHDEAASKSSPALDGTVSISHPDPITGVLWGQPALKQIGTWWFWLVQAFLICYMLRINFYIATVADQVLYYTHDAELAQTLTDAFVLLLPLGGVVSVPFIGYLLDNKSSKAAFSALFILGMVYGVGCMLDSTPAQLVGITAFTVMRPLMYTAISDYFTKVIGIETFGTVYGLANSVSGLCTLLQYAFDYTVKRKLDGNYTPVNIALVTLGAVLAVGVVAKQHRHAKQNEETVEN